MHCWCKKVITQEKILFFLFLFFLPFKTYLKLCSLFKQKTQKLSNSQDDDIRQGVSSFKLYKRMEKGEVLVKIEKKERSDEKSEHSNTNPGPNGNYSISAPLPHYASCMRHAGASRPLRKQCIAGQCIAFAQTLRGSLGRQH